MRNIGGGLGYGSKEPTERKLYRRKTVNALSENRFDIQTIGAFKLTPSYSPAHFMTNRPLMGKSRQSMTVSARDPINVSLKDLGMRNLFDVRNELSHSGLIGHLFPLEVYTLQRPLFGRYPDISKLVLSSVRVQNALQATAQQLIAGAEPCPNLMSQHLKLLKKKSQKIIKSMKASVSPVFLSLTAWFLTRFLSNFIQSVLVSRGQMMVIKKAQEKEVPIIYLPLHKSHLDYILVTLILWHYDVRAPHVAAGDNIDIPVFSSFMRALGGFFIRRKLDTKKGEKDVLYRAILHEYMNYLLKKGEGLEFFIEGGRTRTGRSVNPKGGLLSVVVEACTEKEISDALIVPVSFSYEKIIDGNYNREQMGQPKVKETFIGAVRAILGVLVHNYGMVRVDFCQPFSLQEFVRNAKEIPYLPFTLGNPVKNLSPHTSYPNLTQSFISSSSTKDYEQTRLVTKALADHVVHAADRASPPMATQLTAFLMLTKYRRGVYTKQLVQALTWIVRELQGHGVDVGFCGQPLDAIRHAQRLFGDGLITQSWHAVNGDTMLIPNLTLPSVFELSYYANAVTTHFALESVVAAAILYESGMSFYNLLTYDATKQVEVSRDKVLELAEELCTLLHNEFIFVAPCENISTALMDTLENLILKEVLFIEEKDNDQLIFEGKDRRWADRLAMALDPDEEDTQGMYKEEQPLVVNLQRSDIRERLHFLVSVTAPILETYMIAGKFVLDGLVHEQEEQDFFRDLGEFSRDRVDKDLTIFSESCAMTTLKSAVRAFENLDLIYTYRGANLIILGLKEEAVFIKKLEAYVALLQAILS